MIESAILAIGSGKFSRMLFDSLNKHLQIQQLIIYQCRTEDVQSLAIESSAHDEVGDEIQRYIRHCHAHDSDRGPYRPSKSWDIRVSSIDSTFADGAANRTRLYDDYGLAGKLSVIKRMSDQVLALSLYRSREAGPFTAKDRAKLEVYQGYLAAAIHRHYCWELHQDMPLIERIKNLFLVLSASKRLSEREALVCAYVLLGYSNEAIALNLDLSFHSIVTYRRRAYAKLGVTSQSELFSIALNGCGLDLRATLGSSPSCLAGHC